MAGPTHEGLLVEQVNAAGVAAGFAIIGLILFGGWGAAVGAAVGLVVGQDA